MFFPRVCVRVHVEKTLVALNTILDTGLSFTVTSHVSRIYLYRLKFNTSRHPFSPALERKVIFTEWDPDGVILKCLLKTCLLMKLAHIHSRFTVC